MNILGINGSPRIGGNTDILLDKILEGAGRKDTRTEKIILNTLKYSPCQECENMPVDRPCIIDDDMQLVYKKIKRADVVILASPIFFGSLSAQVKTMIDRFQCLWRARQIGKKEIFKKKKEGYFICVEASRRKAFFENARSIVKNFFAVINAEYKEELFCPGIEERRDVCRYPHILKKAYALGERIKKGDGFIF